MSYNEARFEQARRNLTQFMRTLAARYQRHYGFGYVDVDDAPSTYEGVREAMDISVKTGFAYPVFSGACENTIYTSREGNLAFRFVHDMQHWLHNLQFNLIDEVAAAKHVCDMIAKEYGKDSLEYRIAVLDSAGQSVYAETHGGEFPENQLNFIRASLQNY